MFLNILKRVDSILESFCSRLLVFFLLSILFLSCSAIVLRQFGISFLWLEPLVRHMVFACVFFGGAIATGKGDHIGIDIVSRYLESKNLNHFLKYHKILLSLVSFVTLIWLVKSSLYFVEIEKEYGKDVFWGIHSSILVSIIPIGFSLIAFRFFVTIWSPATNQDRR